MQKLAAWALQPHAISDTNLFQISRVDTLQLLQNKCLRITCPFFIKYQTLISLQFSLGTAKLMHLISVINSPKPFLIHVNHITKYSLRKANKKQLFISCISNKTLSNFCWIYTCLTMEWYFTTHSLSVIYKIQILFSLIFKRKEMLKAARIFSAFFCM